MTIYLVDMENIPHAWAKLLEGCSVGDRFVLFYTEQVGQVPIALMKQVTESQAQMEYVKCHNGPNGLDFQLVTEMGYRVAKDPSAEYIIVSQDHGFDVVIDYWGERGIQTKRVVPSISDQGGIVSEYDTDGRRIEAQDFDLTDPQRVKDFLYWKLSNKAPKKDLPSIVELLMETMVQGTDYTPDRRLSCRFTYLDKALRKKYGDIKGPRVRDQIKAVSREVFMQDLRDEETGQPEAAAVVEEEAAPNPMLDQLLAQGISGERAEEVCALIGEIIQSGAARQKADVYRRMLSTYGRKEGTELYRAVKDLLTQLIADQPEAI